jgi:2,3-bisphosphoglycerate-independent phosphoglycerate mutase
MKYIVLLGDGMSDLPVNELKGKTSLEAAYTPHMDSVASQGEFGMVRTVPKGFHPGSDVANLSVLGYDPALYYSGRSPLEAASIGVDLTEDDVAFRCNLVTFGQNGSHVIMEDYSAGHIPTQEADILIKDLDRTLGTEDFSFYTGKSYRHLMVWKNGEPDMVCTAPHDISSRCVDNYLPQGKGSDVLRNMMYQSQEILREHPVNRQRRDKGLKPVSSIWLWGQGKRPQLPLFRDKYGLEGALISAVDLTRGIGIYAGFRIIIVPGATGYIDTNYEGKALAALEALRNIDFVYLHVEAPDEAGHNGDVEIKIRAIEDFDKKVVGTVLTGIKTFKDYSLLIMPDHPTPISLKTHTSDPVPFALMRSTGIIKDRKIPYNENIQYVSGAKFIEKGHTLMEHFLMR